MFANFSWFWKRKFQTLLSLLVYKDVDQKCSAISQYWGLYFVPLPPIITIFHPVLFILCLIDVKRVIAFDHSSVFITHLLIKSFNLLCVNHVQCVMSYIFQYQQITVGDPSGLFILCLPILSLMCDVCRSFYHLLEVQDLI